MKRETVMLAHNYSITDKVEGWYCSRKLDGMRCFWDGGISRGMDCKDVPYANTSKHGRYRETPLATGLWSRYLQPIQAPGWWLDKLPPFCLDGELWGYGISFQEIMRVVKKLVPECGSWEQIGYHVFDIPSIANFLQEGRVKNPGIEIGISREAMEWAMSRVGGDRPLVYTFNHVVEWLEEGGKDLIGNDVVRIVDQSVVRNSDDVLLELEMATREGFEGIMLRNPNSYWKTERSHDLLKVKKMKDAEGVVLGYTSGIGKLAGLMGALICSWNGRSFEISGFTDQEREMVWMKNGSSAREHVSMMGGKILSAEVINRKFPIGSIIRFRYQDLSLDGTPRFARYFR